MILENNHAPAAKPNDVRQERTLLQLLMNLSTDGILALDGDGRIMEVNSLFLDLWGLNQSEWRTRSGLSIFAVLLGKLQEPHGLLSTLQTLDVAPTTEAGGELKRIDGTELSYRVYPQVFEGKNAGWIWRFWDKSAKSAQSVAPVASSNDNIAELQGRIDALYRSTAVIEFTPDGYILNANDIFCNAMGYRLDEIKGKHHKIFVIPSEANSESYLKFWRERGAGLTFDGEFTRVKKDGSLIYLLGSYNPILDPKTKACLKVIKFVTDVTSQRQAEQIVSEKNRQLETAQTELVKFNIELKLLAEAINRTTAVIEFTPDGYILNANPLFCNAIGYALDEIKGKHHRMFVLPEEAASQDYVDFWKRLESGNYIQGEFKRVKKDGSYIWLIGNYNPVFGANGKPYKVIKFVTDITELQNYRNNLEKVVAERTRQLQESQSQLMQSEKMAALGQMVAGIAHEVNTPLGFVRNNVEVIERNQTRMLNTLAGYHSLRDSLINGELDDVEKKLMEVAELAQKVEKQSFLENCKAIIEESLTGIDRIQELVGDLKNFSRVDEAVFKQADINKGIESTLKIGQNVLKHKVQIKKEFAPDLVAECYPAKMNQVFLNLITNSAHAIEDEGVITIRTCQETVDGAPMAVIKIADTGKGIPPENLKKIFEPFFTTKAIGQGTGLGLSIAYKIIEQHRGTITAQSEVGKGTEFTIKIPMKQSPVKTQSIMQPA